jgi:hypothetical protein
LWHVAIDRFEHRRKLREPILAVDAGVEMKVHQMNRPGRHNHSRDERNPAARPEAQAMVGQGEHAHVVERVSTDDSQALRVRVSDGIGRRINGVELQTLAQRRDEGFAVQ